MHVSIKQRLPGFPFFENFKKWAKVIFYVAWLVLPSMYFWSNSTVCTVAKVELGAELRLAQRDKSFPVTTLYEYTHRSQPYVVEIVKKFSSPQKGKQWIAKHPVGSRVGCLVGIFNPESIRFVPLGMLYVNEMFSVIFYPAIGLLLLMVFGVMKLYFPFGITFGPQIRYERLGHQDLDELIKARYQDEIVQLHKLGLQDFCSYMEVLPKYSAIWSFFESLEMRKAGEVVHVQSPFQLTLLHPLLVVLDQSTYASITAKGVWFFTLLTNGNAIITGTHSVHRNFYDHKLKLQVRSTGDSIEDTWTYHLELLEEFRKEGISAIQERSFERYADMARRKDQSTWENNRWFE